jgi:hypothetical protein
MDIQYEASLTQGPGTETKNRRDVEGLEDGVHGNAVAIPSTVREIDRLAIHEDQVHLRVWYAEALNHVFDGCGQLAAVSEAHLAPLFW